MRVLVAEELRHRVGVGVRVVDAVDHRGLVGHPAAGRPRVLAGGLDDLLDGPATVERHEDVAQGVARGVERDRERELRPERGQPADPGHDPGRAHRDVPRAEPEAGGVVERGDRLEHPVEVEQRLAHAHEHDVRQPRALGREAPPSVAHLVHDLRGLEVALHAQLAGGAERAADRAPGLRADAQGVALAAAGPRRVVHQDALDQQPVAQAVERLLREDAVGVADLAVLDRVEPEGRLERRLRRRGERRQLVERGVLRAPHRVHDLPPAEGGLAALDEPRGELVGGEAGDARALVARERGGRCRSQPLERDHDRGGLCHRRRF